MSYIGDLSSPLNRARRILGDTGVDGGVELLTDDEINAELSELSFNPAVANLALGLASRFGQFPDEVDTAGATKMKWSERVKTWRELAARLSSTVEDAEAPQRKVARLGTLSNTGSLPYGTGKGLRF